MIAMICYDAFSEQVKSSNKQLIMLGAKKKQP
jgi:hypothetical protein